MNDRNTIYISLDRETIKKVLELSFTNNNVNNENILTFFTDILFENSSMTTDFFKILSNCMPKLKFRVGDKVRFKNGIYLYNVDKEASTEKGFMFEDKSYVIIKNINPLKTEGYTGDVTYIDTSGKTCTQSITFSEEKICDDNTVEYSLNHTDRLIGDLF